MSSIDTYLDWLGWDAGGVTHSRSLSHFTVSKDTICLHSPTTNNDDDDDDDDDDNERRTTTTTTTILSPEVTTILSTKSLPY